MRLAVVAAALAVAVAGCGSEETTTPGQDAAAATTTELVRLPPEATGLPAWLQELWRCLLRGDVQVTDVQTNVEVEGTHFSASAYLLLLAKENRETFQYDADLLLAPDEQTAQQFATTEHCGSKGATGCRGLSVYPLVQQGRAILVFSNSSAPPGYPDGRRLRAVAFACAKQHQPEL